MSQTEHEIKLPIKRTTGETLKERLTENAYQRILPARYLQKDENGEITEEQEDLFERVAKNIALAEAVYEAEKRNKSIRAKPSQIKPNHSNREKLVREVFGDDVSINQDVKIELAEDNINKFAYDTITPELPDEIRQHVEEVKQKFQEIMEDLSFIPNSPTLMNAGDELQQLSACFVNSPKDDMEDIHQTAKEAAAVFQSGGGMGYAFWNLRPYGDPVGSTGGIASGPITFMRTYDQLCETIAQGGTRRGAQMGVMRVSHPDVIQFIHAKNKDVSLANTLRLNDPDDYTHTSFVEALDEARELIDEEGRVPKHLRNAAEGHLSNFNISVGVSHEFMDALEKDGDFTFINPRTKKPHIANENTKELYARFGLGEYIEVGEPLEIPAREIWNRIIKGAYENGEPGVIYLDRVNDEHSFDVEEHPEHEILATNPCVTGDTLISTERGLISAEELYNQGVSNDVVVDERLSEERIREASSVYKTGVKEVYTLRTEEGYELKLTADHRVRTPDGWVEAGELERGDEVLILNQAGGFGAHGSNEEGMILGWLVANGDIDPEKESASLNFDEERKKLFHRFAEHLSRVSKGSISEDQPSIGIREMKTADDGSESKSLGQKLVSSELFHQARNFGLHEQKVQVPAEVMRSSKEMAMGFIQSIFTAKAGIYDGNKEGALINLTCTNGEFLKDMQRLLLNFGVPSRVHQDSLGRSPSEESSIREDEHHTLLIENRAAARFRDEIGFLEPEKKEELDAALEGVDELPGDDFKAVVESVSLDGKEEVYDLTEPVTHSFTANGLVVHNCGEQPLEEYEACNLGHINLSTLASTQTPDWRAWYAENKDSYPSMESAVEAFLEEAIDWDEMNNRIDLGTRFLENVVTMSDFPVEKIEEKVSSMRKIGLGIMGLAQFYIQLGVKYGSEPANEMAKQVMMHINHGSKHTSHELALERGSFDEWDKSKYSDPMSHREWFEKQTGKSADEWSTGYPIRNHNTTTIAPTGTTSMIGNTTGGCEPIYNVAYYKNVSDDVQGEEMLVEFDDYFLRVLKANDIDIDEVKEEAKQQMANNEFSGVKGLESVPDEIGELFVTTSDIAAKEHAAVQCACQHGVDSAISKTCNFPHDAAKEDMDEVYRYIYRHGGKGVTVYRDGTRSKQVLTTRADNKESTDNTDPVETVREMIAEGEIEPREVVGDKAEYLGSTGFEPRARPSSAVKGSTQKIETGYGGLYVTINEDDKGLFEVFTRIGKSGGYTTSFTEAIARLISLCLRSGIPPERVIEQLEGIRSPKVTFHQGEQIHSVPDAIAKAMKRHMSGDLDFPEQAQLPVSTESGSDEEDDGGEHGASDIQALIDRGRSPECPECDSMLVYTEGCVKCNECGYSEC